MRNFIFGNWSEETLTAQGAQDLCETARHRQLTFSKIPLDETLEVFDRVRMLWIQPESPWRKAALEVLTQSTGFSPKMIGAGLNEIGSMFDPEVLMKKVETELRGVPVGEGFKFQSETGTMLQYLPLGTLLHVLSGNVFLVGLGSLIEGVLTKNVSILKMPSEETYFLPKFIESLQRVDTKGILTSSIAAISYSSQQHDVIEILKKNVDGLIIWGGETAVKTYRNGLPARTRTVVFGPKVSFAVVTKQGLKDSIDPAARKLADELAIWDQNACTAPQVCFVEGEENSLALTEALATALEQKEKEWPAGHMGPDNATEIRKLRGVAEISEARGLGLLKTPKDNSLNWTVIMEKSLKFDVSPLHRTLKILPYEQLSQVVEAVEPYRGYLQTIGVASTPSEQLEIAKDFGVLGAQRIFTLGEMSGGEIDDPHDGAYDLPQLLNLAVVRNRDQHLDPWEYSEPSARLALVNASLRMTLKKASKSPFFAERMKGIEVKGVEDLEKIPPLTRAEWEGIMFPKTARLQTRKPSGGYVTRSGGSTGEPKFSYFDKEDWQLMLKSAARMFRAAGMNSSDRLANFMSAGHLYGSFISFNDVNNELGVMNFCFAAENDATHFIDIKNRFNINAAQGVPNNLVRFFRECKQLDPTFQIEKVFYAGQPMSPSDRKWLKENLGVKVISSIIGTTEANHVGYQCTYTEGLRHHLVDEYNWIEIVDESGKRLPDGENGLVAITNLQKTNFPVIRYLNGDTARILNEKCLCGRSDRLIEYLGRADDIICLGKMNINAADVRRALEGLEISEIQLQGKTENACDTLTLRIETAAEDIRASVRRRLVERLSEFGHMIEKNELDLCIEQVQPGGLVKNSRTGKIKTIVDERFLAASSSSDTTEVAR